MAAPAPPPAASTVENGDALGARPRPTGNYVVAHFPARAGFGSAGGATSGSTGNLVDAGGAARVGGATGDASRSGLAGGLGVKADPQAELARIASTARLSARAPRRVARGAAADIVFTLDLGGRRAETVAAAALSFRDPDDAFNLRPATDPLVWITPSTTEPLTWRIAATADRPGGRALLVSARFDAPGAAARTEPKLLEISVDDQPDGGVGRASLMAGLAAFLFLFGMVFPALLDMFFN